MYKKGLILILAILISNLKAQAPTFDEMNFDIDSSLTAYKPGKNFAFTKSKKGSGAMAKLSKIDSIAKFPVNEIVLVFSETSTEDITERDAENQARWENLLISYPDIFQFSTVFKNHCQYNYKGDTVGFKATQGFYIYYTPPAPKKETAPVKVEEKKEIAKVEKTENKPKEEKVTLSAKENQPKNEDKKDTKKTEPVVHTNSKQENTKVKTDSNKKEDDGGEFVEGPEATTEINENDFKTKKKVGYNKPKKAKDPKACRPAFYGNYDDDLNNFFVSSITLTKKQRRHSKQLVSMVRIQLSFDGSIKKAMVTGTNTELNETVTNAIKQMDLWNPTVKNGITVKSEVRFTLKYNKDKKGLIPEEMTVNPRLAPKCKCVPDSELFAD